MKRASTQSFVLTLKLNTSKDDERVLMRRFFCGWKIYNILVRHVKQAITSMKQDPAYRTAMERYLANKKASGVKKELSDIREAYGLSEYELHKFVKLQQKRYVFYIDSMTAQKIASQVWQAAQDVLFGSGNRIHFRRFNDFDSLEGKTNQSGIRFKAGRLYWNKLIIQPQIKTNDSYLMEALNNRVKYCRIKRMVVSSRYQFYLQLIMEGTAPVKHVMGKGRCGIDIGTSTVAIVSKNGCALQVLAEKAESIEKKQRRLQRKLDRSRRILNPKNYHADGTVKKGPKSWQTSKTYLKEQIRLKNLYRKRAAIVKQSHEAEINKLITHADDFYVETMSFKGLAKRSKKTVKNPSGRYKKKARFGKSISNRAPAMFLSILEQKLNAQGGHLYKVNTNSFKASQYDHISDTCKKKSLSERWTSVGEDLIQRDLYSAFLLMNSNDDKSFTDRTLCYETYQAFKQNHDKLINELKASKKHLPRSFGIKKKK